MKRLVALLALVACVPVRAEVRPSKADFPAVLMFADDFAYTEEVEAAARFWNAQAGRALFTLDFGEANSVVGITYEDASPADPKNGRTELAVTRADGLSVVFFDGWRRASEADQISVARHELGHVLGFEHVELRDCLMFPTVFSAGEPRGLCDAERAALPNIR